MKKYYITILFALFYYNALSQYQAVLPHIEITDFNVSSCGKYEQCVDCEGGILLLNIDMTPSYYNHPEDLNDIIWNALIAAGCEFVGVSVNYNKTMNVSINMHETGNTRTITLTGARGGHLTVTQEACQPGDDDDDDDDNNNGNGGGGSSDGSGNNDNNNNECQNEITKTLPHILFASNDNECGKYDLCVDCEGGSYTVNIDMSGSYYTHPEDLVDQLNYALFSSDGCVFVSIESVNYDKTMTINVSPNETDNIRSIKLTGELGGHITVTQDTCPPPQPISGIYVPGVTITDRNSCTAYTEDPQHNLIFCNPCDSIFEISIIRDEEYNGTTGFLLEKINDSLSLQGCHFINATNIYGNLLTFHITKNTSNIPREFTLVGATGGYINISQGKCEEPLLPSPCDNSINLPYIFIKDYYSECGKNKICLDQKENDFMFLIKIEPAYTNKNDLLNNINNLINNSSLSDYISATGITSSTITFHISKNNTNSNREFCFGGANGGVITITQASRMYVSDTIIIPRICIILSDGGEIIGESCDKCEACEKRTICLNDCDEASFSFNIQIRPISNFVPYPAEYLIEEINNMLLQEYPYISVTGLTQSSITFTLSRNETCNNEERIFYLKSGWACGGHDYNIICVKQEYCPIDELCPDLPSPATTFPPPNMSLQEAINNWIIKTTYTEPEAANYYRDITYYDGLGYPEQVIQIKGSPNMKNIVTPVYYDNMRRDNAKVYLSYVSTNDTATRENSPFTAQTVFYQNIFGVADGQYAYVENMFEASPLNRILQTYNVGAVYRNEDKKSVNVYSANGASEVFLMNVNPANGNVTVTGRYAANTLYKNSTMNEDGTIVYTYTDKLGQTVLTRTKGDNSQNFDTYYVYNDKGQLVMVIPPEYSSGIGINTTLIPGSTVVAHYCYTYKYDGRGNMTERQMPGKAAEYMIYDKGGRLILSQDGNMRANNEWIYNVYDNVGNLIDKTLVKTNLTREQIQNLYHSSYFDNRYESLGNAGCIYIPFGETLDFESLYLIESTRYYGKSYYERNELAPGIYLRVNERNFFIRNSITLNENYENKIISSIDIGGIIKLPIGIKDPPVGKDTSIFDNPTGECDSLNVYVNADKSINETYLYYDDNNTGIKYYNIPDEYMSIAECLVSINPSAYSIFEGTPVGNTAETVIWENPLSLAFEPVTNVCSYADLDTIKIKNLKAYEHVRILNEAGDYIDRCFHYDKLGRVIQTVEKNHLGYISRYSVKYDFIGNVLAQHEKHVTGSNTTDEKLTLFTYDHRGRLLAEATTVNGSDTAKVEYKYNELGQQIAKIYDNNLITDSVKYNIQGWITEKNATTGTDGVFNMKLAYYSPVHANTAPSYTGNITEWTWQHGNMTANTYAFAYDKLSRLTGSLQYVNSAPSNAFTEQSLTYSKNGNILTLKRYGETSLTDDIVCGYSGNRLWTVNNTPAYNYDSNGNMNKDYRKNLDFEYNLLNLPYQIKQQDTVKATYTYIADGTKASVKDSAGKGFDYLGSLVYVNDNNVRTFESTSFGGGRINKTNNAYDINYFITDHLGSTRVIVDNAGEIKGQYNYYPFGKQWEDINLMANTNRYTFSGKEKQTIRDLGYLDFGARMLETEIGRWFVIDPLAEKYYSVSPYVYCMNNPLKYVDPDGRKVSIAYLSTTHQKSLQTFLSTQTGKTFVGRYMNAGETLIVNGQKYTFNKTGDRAKDLLSIQSRSMDALGKNKTLIKGTARETSESFPSDVDKTIKDGVQQIIALNKNIDEKTATGVLGHEAFVHADKDANALNELEANSQNMTQDAKIKALQDISNAGGDDHKDLGDNKVTKFKQYMNELTKLTGDKYYEQEYQRQVQYYKNH